REATWRWRTLRQASPSRTGRSRPAQRRRRRDAGSHRVSLRDPWRGCGPSVLRPVVDNAHGLALAARYLLRVRDIDLDRNADHFLDAICEVGGTSAAGVRSRMTRRGLDMHDHP